VQQKSVVACVLLTAEDGTVQRHVRTFAPRTADLLALNDWLNAQQVEQVAMESTGVYLSTLRKQGVALLAALETVFADHPLYPTFA
jgi:hypothetical protein